MIQFRRLALCATVAFVFTVPCASRAANILITDKSPLGITFAVGNFEEGFSAGGRRLGIGLGNYPPATFASTSPVSFSGTWIDLGQTPTTSSATWYFVNPFKPSDVVDKFSFTASTTGDLGTITGTITSYIGMGTEGTLPSPPPRPIFSWRTARASTSQNHF